MRHEKTQMKFIARFAQVHTYSTLRRGSIWYYLFECPLCGRQIRPAQNPNRGKVFYCSGQAKEMRLL